MQRVQYMLFDTAQCRYSCDSHVSTLYKKMLVVLVPRDSRTPKSTFQYWFLV